MEVKTLDFSHFSRGTEAERAEFVSQLLESVTTNGLAKLINHDITDEYVKEAFYWNRKFFELPVETKSKIIHPQLPTPQRGWCKVGAESTWYLYRGKDTEQSGKQYKDVKEHFDMGSLDDAQYPNKWLADEELPGFRAFAEDYFNRLQALSIQIMAALEAAMDLPKGVIVDRCSGSASEIRWNHYPQVRVSDINSGTSNRIWPHTDFGVLTLLFQDDVGGLEFQDSKNPDVFVPVTKTANEMIINCGDTLQRWTNNFLKAGLHQVTTPVDPNADEDQLLKDRYSIAFFLKADRDARAAPIEKFVPEGTVSQYKDVSALEYQVSKNVPLY